MADVRVSTMLPAIKCSNCGAQIEISMMGEHVCSSSEREIPLPPLPNNISHRFWNSEKPPRQPIRRSPPQIDPAVANNHYTNKSLLQPTSTASTQDLSPVSPLEFEQTHSVQHKTQQPSRFRTPPSPDFSPNLDCAFPPFSTALPTGPDSPATTPKILQHSKNERPGADTQKVKDFVEQRTVSEPTTRQDLGTGVRDGRSADHAAAFSQTYRNQGAPSAVTPSANSLTMIRQLAAPQGSNGQKSRTPPARPSRPDDVDGFLMSLRNDASGPSTQGAQQILRANTFPLPASDDTAFSMGARGIAEPTVLRRRPTISRAPVSVPIGVPQVPSIVGPEVAPLRTSLATRSPPRSSSRSAFRSDNRLPPISYKTPVHRHLGAHTPSDSASSTASSVSASDRSLRSRTSGIASPSSSVSAVSSSFPEKSFHTPGLTPEREITPQPTPYAWSPSERPYASLAATAAVDPVVPAERPRTAPSHECNVEQPESPCDPIIQLGAIRQPQRIQKAAAPAFPLREASPPCPTPTTTQAQTPTWSSSPVDRRPATGPKHVCRGCEEPIVGRSVKAADGRLTGRYHKDCFVCKTCKTRFATADFYVIDNDPYCEHHYHMLNDSLCTSCNHGIEGQYLETQQRQKFHPRCLTCTTCTTILSDDYFEINGRKYCEGHAFAALRSGSGGREGGLGPKRNMERRTTRLMVM